MKENATDLTLELDWLAEVLGARLRTYFGAEPPGPAPAEIIPPVLTGSPYSQFVYEHALSWWERAVLALAMVPYVRPNLLDMLWIKNEATERGYTEFGGWTGSTHGGFIPTGETASFLLAGDGLSERFLVAAMFEADHLFARLGVLSLAAVASNEPVLSGALTMSREYLDRFTSGMDRRPGFSSEFPARLVQTELTWDDLVLPATTLAQLDEIRQWLEYGATLLGEWGMSQKLRPGFTSLFHGPPGTGKTLTACLLGRHCGSDVYKVDLSMIVSKYIGETEKNLAKVFDMAEHRGWILFFDEADALFGRRTRVDSSHDRYANQEISFLLQRIEEFNGVVILASNLKNNIDDAFLRRFHSVVYFPMPKPAERLRIWRNAFSEKAVLEPAIDLARLAEKHELSGGTVMNVVRFCSLKALSRGNATILLDDMEEGIRRELLKEGKTM